MLLDKPNADILEISLFGTGGGYGESIVIHFPQNKWIVIDSCIDPTKKLNIPLTYLTSVGVNLNDVKFIIATHWHNDHILGLSDIVEKCQNAELVFARPTDQQKFARLVSLDTKKSSNSQSTSEYSACIKLTKERGYKLKEAISDRVLFSERIDGIPLELISLSPSDYANHLFDLEISELMNNFGAANKKIIYTSPNFRSIVLLVKAGSHRAILGADLEVGNDERLGWKHIISNTVLIDEKATLFKIPHHGSDNGYSDDIWKKLVANNPKTGITPWNRNTKLPNAKMLSLYSELSDSLYITSPNIDLRRKKKDRRIERLLDHFGAKVKEISFSFGQVRYRASIKDNITWAVDVAGEAFHVNPTLKEGTS
ncbi:MBL fold metallo-hydrolase (plasmid) [Adhaeribacter swui]|uniref:MBL fold metallo-hydrolase n=1 Tax=Adhaeribacter swui TaxID=2086471 RepID=A0A7G7G2C3_9BACT|nr:MBL fold metallo-hydrolase [Adhaeribacter swui]QNF31307.1 MBL fold metallo-hydrolase [Adhaeribacter swui]